MTDTLYVRIGGSEAVDRLVVAFYDRVLADPELAPFFEGARLERLRRMQHELFSQALGGPAEYSGMGLADAHAGRGIQAQHVARFLQHLVDTLAEVEELDRDDVDSIAERIALLAPDVTGETGEDG